MAEEDFATREVGYAQNSLQRGFGNVLGREVDQMRSESAKTHQSINLEI